MPFWKSVSETQTHHHLHSFPQSSPQTQTARLGRCVWRKLQRSRWPACSPGDGSPSVHTRRNLWSLQERKWAPRSGQNPACATHALTKGCCPGGGGPHRQVSTNSQAHAVPARTSPVGMKRTDAHTMFAVIKSKYRDAYFRTQSPSLSAGNRMEQIQSCIYSSILQTFIKHYSPGTALSTCRNTSDREESKRQCAVIFLACAVGPLNHFHSIHM